MANKSTKNRKTKPPRPRCMTLPEFHAACEAEELEKVEAEKAAKKKVDDAARTRRIYQEIDNRVFDAPLSTYNFQTQR
jgi:hypothetical protein